MLKGKVYLSRSGAGNATLVNTIRELLKRDPNVQLVEYTGTTYTVAEDEKLKSCDMLIIVPPTTPDDFQDNDVYIGKGQYTQIEVFAKAKNLHFDTKEHSEILVVCEYFQPTQTVTLRKVWDLHNEDGDWKNSYGRIEMYDCSPDGDVNDEYLVFYQPISSTPTTPVNDDEKKKLLI